MYIKYENQKYSCKCDITNDAIYYKELPDNFPETVEGEIVLCDNAGFELRKDKTENYKRQTFENGTLMLTNAPEVEPLPEPPEPEPSAEELLDILLGVTE